MRNFNSFVIALGFFFGYCPVFSQTPSVDVVYLKDGSIFRGEMVEYKKGGALTLRLQNGIIVVFDYEEIDKIIQTGNDLKDDNIEEFPFEKNEIFNTTYLWLSHFGENELGRNTTGMGIHYILGYQKNQWLGLGIGFGYERYFFFGELGSIVPIYGHLRGYLNRRINAPYYNLSLGYNLAFKGEDKIPRHTVIDTRGGIFLHPAIGFRFGSSSQADFIVDVGYQLHFIGLTYAGIFLGDDFRLSKSYNRLILKLGITF